MRPMIAAVLCMLTTAASAASPPPAPRGSLSVIGGTGTTYDDESSLGRGMLLGAAYDRLLFGTTYADVSLELLTHDRTAGYFQSIGRTVIGGVSLLHRFGRGDVQPYVFGGLTAGSHTGTNTLAMDPFTVSSTRAGSRIGFGLTFRGQHVEISPELRMNSFFTKDDSDPWMAPSFGVRVGWRR